MKRFEPRIHTNFRELEKYMDLVPNLQFLFPASCLLPPGLKVGYPTFDYRNPVEMSLRIRDGFR